MLIRNFYIYKVSVTDGKRFGSNYKDQFIEWANIFPDKDIFTMKKGFYKEDVFHDLYRQSYFKIYPVNPKPIQNIAVLLRRNQPVKRIFIKTVYTCGDTLTEQCKLESE